MSGQSVASPYGSLHQLVYVIDATTSTNLVYVDGVYVGSITGENFILNSPTAVLGATNLRNDAELGVVGFAAYNMVLSSAEVLAHYQAFQTPQPISNPVVKTATDIPKTISSSGANTITSTLTVTNLVGSLTDVNITVDITHTYTGDLDIYLIHPDGTRVELTTDNGGGGDHFTGTTFDQSSSQLITSGSAPFSGVFRPEGDLNTLNTKTANGVWTLEVGDDADFDGGTLNSWSIELAGVSESVAPVASDSSFGVAENVSIGTAVGTVIATDSNAGQTLSYAITAGNTGEAFAVNNMGEITTATLLDFETTPIYTLTVTVSDDATPSLSDTATITVNVTDVIPGDDSDADWLNDNWEVTHYGNLTSVVAWSDSDADGLTSFQEMVFGTNPNVNSSTQSPVQNRIVDEGGLDKLEFKFSRPQSYANLNVIYTLESSGDMESGNWAPMVSIPIITPSGSNEWLTYLLPIPSGGEIRVFYRVSVTLAP